MSGQIGLDSEQCEYITSMLEEMGIDYKNEEVTIHISEYKDQYELEDSDVNEDSCDINIYVQTD